LTLLWSVTRTLVLICRVLYCVIGWLNLSRNSRRYIRSWCKPFYAIFSNRSIDTCIALKVGQLYSNVTDVIALCNLVISLVSSVIFILFIFYHLWWIKIIIRQRHRAVSLPQHDFRVGLCLQTKVSEERSSHRDSQKMSSTTPLSFDVPHRGNPSNINMYLIFLETRIIDLHSAADSIGLPSFNLFRWPP